MNGVSPLKQIRKSISQPQNLKLRLKTVPNNPQMTIKLPIANQNQNDPLNSLNQSPKQKQKPFLQSLSTQQLLNYQQNSTNFNANLNRKQSVLLRKMSVMPNTQQQKDYAQLLQQKLDVLIQEREQESQKLLFGIGQAAITKSLFGDMGDGENGGASPETKLMITQRLKGKQKEVNKQSNFDKIIERQNERKQSRVKSRGKTITNNHNHMGDGDFQNHGFELFETNGFLGAPNTTRGMKSTSLFNPERNFQQKISIFDRTKKFSTSTQSNKFLEENQQRICIIWKKLGRCPEDEKCPFAHSESDIRYYRPNIWKNLVKTLNDDKNSDTDDSQSQVSLQKSPQRYIIKFNGKIDNKGKTDLMEACKTNNAQGVQYLLQNGAKVNQKDFFSRDSIYYCVKYQNYEALTVLIKQSLFFLDNTVTYANLYGNILHIACQNSELNSTRILQKILDTELYDVNVIDKYERSPIFYVVMRGDFESAQLLIKKCSFLDFEDTFGKTLIDYARDVHSEKILGLLVDSGENLGKNMCKGIELLFDCVKQQWLELFKSLIKKGVPIASVDHKTGDNVLLLAYQLKNQEILQFLMNSSESTLFSMIDQMGQNILIKAVLRRDLEIIQKWFTTKKDQVRIDQQDVDGRTALMYACELGDMQIAQILLVNGCQINLMDKQGLNAPMICAINDDIQLLQEIFKYQFNINWQDNLGHHIYDYAKSQQARDLIVNYIRLRSEGLSRKDKESLITQLQSKFNSNLTGEIRSTSKLSINSNLINQQKKKKQLKMQGILQQIDQEYKEEYENEMQKGEDGRRVIAEKFLQSRISLIQLTKQALSRPTERMMGKQALVENYFRKEERKIREIVIEEQRRRRAKKIDPRALAIHLKQEREKRSNTADIFQSQKNQNQQIHEENQNLNENFQKQSESQASNRQSLLNSAQSGFRLDTPASSIFQRLRIMKDTKNFDDLENFQSIINLKQPKSHITRKGNQTQRVRVLNKIDKIPLVNKKASQKINVNEFHNQKKESLQSMPKTETAFFNQKKNSQIQFNLTQHNQSQKTVFNEMNSKNHINLLNSLNFKHETKEKKILELILQDDEDVQQKQKEQQQQISSESQRFISINEQQNHSQSAQNSPKTLQASKFTQKLNKPLKLKPVKIASQLNQKSQNQRIEELDNKIIAKNDIDKWEQNSDTQSHSQNIQHKQHIIQDQEKPNFNNNIKTIVQTYQDTQNPLTNNINNHQLLTSKFVMEQDQNENQDSKLIIRRNDLWDEDENRMFNDSQYAQREIKKYFHSLVD
eukprot:403371929